MGWASDRGSGGRRFDSRLPDGFDSGLPGVGSGSLFRRFWDVLGCVWEWFGDVFGWVWDGFEKISDEVGKSKFSKMSGSLFPESGRFRIAFLAYPRTKISIF